MRGMLDIAMVALGGAIGAVSRYAMGRGVSSVLHGHALALPVATLSVNVLGCLGIGMLLPWLLSREGEGAGSHLRLLVVVGVLGSLTTYSTFGYETMSLWREGRTLAAMGTVVLHLALGLGAVALGVWVGQRWLTPS